MKRGIVLILLIIASAVTVAQQVPSRISFANMDLRLTSGAIRDIQADVDALTRSEKYFMKKLERVDMYMPIIERIFREEGLPDDFKYLVIQESALISDAVSSSNAVGFWQFKEISALENDLAINRNVDERMNIVSATRAAATYLKDHNSYFDNWAYALIAYQTGRGGAEKHIEAKNFGSKKMQITKNTYWYLKKYLAHKIAFQNALGTSRPDYFLQEITGQEGRTLADISKDYTISEELLKDYNKWLKRKRIPSDKEYTVILPIRNVKQISSIQARKKYAEKTNEESQFDFPKLGNDKDFKVNATIAHEVEINGKDGILAAKGYDVKSLAEKAGMDEYKFRKFNDMGLRDELVEGMIYYTQRKRNRAKFYYHTVQVGETMWEISQKYALKLKKLYRKNRMVENQQPKVGRVLWLRHNRPADVPIEYRKIEKRPIIKAEKTEDKPSTEDAINPENEKADTATTISTTVSIDSTQLAAAGKSDTVELVDEEKDSAAVKIAETDSINEVLPVADSVVQYSDSSKLMYDADSIQADALNDDKVTITADTTVDNQYMDYTIKKGDTFFSLANRFNMKISTLLEINELSIKDKLSIGQKIKVNKIDEAKIAINENSEDADQEVATINSGNTIQHTVEPGDTMYSLARKYQVSLKEIMEWNNKETAQIKAGEILTIKSK